MARFGKFDDEEPKSSTSPMENHPLLMLWAVGLGYEILIDPAFKEAIYAQQWFYASVYAVGAAFLLSLLFGAISLGVALGASLAVKQQKRDSITFEEWAEKSQWIPLTKESDEHQLRQMLQKAMSNHDSIPSADHLTDQDKQVWDLEYSYRETYLCGRLSALAADRERAKSRPLFLTRFKDQERAEQIWLIAIILAAAVVAAWLLYFQ